MKYKHRDTTRITIPTTPFPMVPNNTAQVVLEWSNPINMFACLNQGIITFSINFQNVVAGNQVTQILPSIAAVSLYTLNLSANPIDKNGLQYSSQPGRGDLGYVISYIDRCSQMTVMEQYPENITNKTFPANTTQISMQIPMSYLIDEFGLRKYLPVANLRLQLTMKNLFNVFSAPNSPNFQIFCNAIYIDYPMYEMEEIPRHLAVIDKRRWQIFDQPLAVNQQQVAFNLTPSGRPIRILHWSFIQIPSTTTLLGGNSFVPNQFSVVTTQQFQAGKYFPPNYSYNTVFDANGNEQNLNILYNELLGATGKASAYENNQLDYVNWRDNNRFYGFMIDDDSVGPGSYPFIVNFSSPATQACIHRCCIQFEC